MVYDEFEVKEIIRKEDPRDKNLGAVSKHAEPKKQVLTNSLVVPTYIRGLDDFIPGGFRPGTVVLINSSDISEVKLFMSQLLFLGMHNDSNNSLYVCLENSVDEVKRRAKDSGFEFEAFENDGLLKFIDGYSVPALSNHMEDTSSVKYVSGAIYLSEILYEISKFNESNDEFSKIVFDSASKLFIDYSEEQVFKFLEALVGKLRSGKAISFIAIDEKMHDSKIVEKLKHLTSCYIDFIDKNDQIFLKTSCMPLNLGRKTLKLEYSPVGFYVTEAKDFK